MSPRRGQPDHSKGYADAPPAAYRRHTFPPGLRAAIVAHAEEVAGRTTKDPRVSATELYRRAAVLRRQAAHYLIAARTSRDPQEALAAACSCFARSCVARAVLRVARTLPSNSRRGRDARRALRPPRYRVIHGERRLVAV